MTIEYKHRNDHLRGRVAQLFIDEEHDAARNLFELNRLIDISEKNLDLTDQQWEVLLLLGENLHNLLDTNEMADVLYDTSGEPTNALVRNHICDIRPKLPDNIMIVTHQGRGYMLTDSDHFSFRESSEEFSE